MKLSDYAEAMQAGKPSRPAHYDEYERCRLHKAQEDAFRANLGFVFGTTPTSQKGGSFYIGSPYDIWVDMEEHFNTVDQLRRYIHAVQREAEAEATGSTAVVSAIAFVVLALIGYVICDALLGLA